MKLYRHLDSGFENEKEVIWKSQGKPATGLGEQGRWWLLSRVSSIATGKRS